MVTGCSSRLLRLFPDLPEAKEIRTVLAEHLTAENLKVEADYFARKESRSFERPYGWAWLLKLAEELNGWDDPDGQAWSRNLRPLADADRRALSGFLSEADLSHPHRRPPKHGVRARVRSRLRPGDWRLAAEGTGRGAGRAYFDADADVPAGWEPGGADFFSPSLMEADLMRSVFPPPSSGPGSSGSCPGAAKGEPKTAVLAGDGDRPDRPAMVHLDGLNLSRAWCMRSIAAALPAGDRARRSLSTCGGRHAQAALGHVASGDYAGEHWLASFAVYLLTARPGTDRNR